MESKKQKIAIFVGAAQGLARYGLSIATALSKRAQVKVVAPSNITSDVSLTSLLERLDVISYDKPAGNSFIKTIISVCRVYIQLLRFNPHVVHETNGATYFSNLLFLPIYAIKPMVVTEHEPVERHVLKASLKKRIASRLYGQIANRFIVHGPYCQEMLNEHINLKKKQVHIIHHGAYDFYKRLSADMIEREPTELLFFGSLRPDKGFEHLPALIQLLDRSTISYRLIVACNSEWPEELNKTEWPAVVEKTMIFLKNHPNVDVQNRFIPDEEVGKYFKKASIIILPYNSATQSGVVTIGLTFGCVPVAFDVGDLGFIIEDQSNGILVEYGAIDQLAGSIVELVNNKEKLNTLSNNAISFSETVLNWDGEIAEKHLQLYEDLISK